MTSHAKSLGTRGGAPWVGDHRRGRRLARPAGRGARGHRPRQEPGPTTRDWAKASGRRARAGARAWARALGLGARARGSGLGSGSGRFTEGVIGGLLLIR